jgi:hypothetical protein
MCTLSSLSYKRRRKKNELYLIASIPNIPNYFFMTIKRFSDPKMAGLVLVLLWSCAQRDAFYQPHLELGAGNTYQYTLIEESHTLCTQKGEKVDTRNGVSLVLLCKAHKKDLDITYGGFALHQQSDSSEVNIDDASALISPDPRARMFGAFHGATIGCCFDPRGRILSLPGLDSVYRKMAVLGREEGVDNGPTAQVWQRQFSPDYFSRLLEKSFCLFPDVPVAVGDTWVGVDSLDADPRIPLVTYYTLQKVRDGILYIHAESAVDITDRSLEATGRSGKLTLTGRQHGILQVDAATGVVLSGQTILKANGALTMGDVELPLIIDSTYTVTASRI